MADTLINTTQLLVALLVVITCIGVLVYQNYWGNSNEEFVTSTCGEGKPTVIKNLVIPYFYDKVPNTPVSPETKQRYEQAQIPKDRPTPANSVSGKVNGPVGIVPSTNKPAPSSTGVSSTLKKDAPALERVDSMKDTLIPTIPVDLPRYYCGAKYHQKQLNIDLVDLDDIFPDDSPLPSCEPIKNKVPSCKRLLNVVTSFDLKEIGKCLNRVVFDKIDPVTGKSMRLRGKDYADCYRKNKIEHLNTYTASIAEFSNFNNKVGANCPNKEGLDVYLLVLTTWAKGKGLMGHVREQATTPRLKYGLLMKVMSSTYARVKPLIDYYKQQGDKKVIDDDYVIQVWFRELLAKCVDMLKIHVRAHTKKIPTNADFIHMPKNNVDLYFLQGILMLCMITNTDFSGLFNDCIQIIGHDIDDQGFMPAEARGDKSIAYVMYSLPPIMDILYYFNLFYGLKVDTSSKLNTKMLLLFHRIAHINLDIVKNPDQALVTEIQKFQTHIVDLNTTKKYSLTDVLLIPGKKTLNLTLPDKKSEYLMFKKANTTSSINGYKARYNTLISDIPASEKVRNRFIYVKNNPTINIGLKMPDFLSIVSKT